MQNRGTGVLSKLHHRGFPRLRSRLVDWSIDQKPERCCGPTPQRGRGANPSRLRYPLLRRCGRRLSVLLISSVDSQRLVLTLTFLQGGPTPDFRRVGELAQALHDAPPHFEGHLSRDHLLFSFPRRDEERCIASCANFVSVLNQEGRVHRGQLVDAVTHRYDHGQVHEYGAQTTQLPAIVVSKAICDRLRPQQPHPSLLLVDSNETVVRPFAAAERLADPAVRAAWVKGCREALARTAASPEFHCPRFGWLLDVLGEVGRGLSTANQPN